MEATASPQPESNSGGPEAPPQGQRSIQVGANPFPADLPVAERGENFLFSQFISFQNFITSLIITADPAYQGAKIKQ